MTDFSSQFGTRASAVAPPLTSTKRAIAPTLVALIVLLLIAAAPVAAQVRAITRVSASRVDVGDRLTYTLVLRGTAGGRFPTPPSTGGLRAVQASPTSDATMQVNGDIQREVTWTFEAVGAGSARIGPYRADIGGGRTIVAAATSITVASGAPNQVRPQQPVRPVPMPNAAPYPTPGAPPNTGPAERADLFARIELSDERVVVGQQVVAEIVLYFSPDLQLRQTIASRSWDTPGFWREELEVSSTVPRPVTLGGRAFEALTVMRVALFPTQAGRLTLPPMAFTVDFLSIDPFGFDPTDPFAPFFAPFSGGGLDEAAVEAPAVALEVAPLPPGAPAGFSGAVGQFTMRGTPLPATVAAGDPVPVEVTIDGTGNLATLGAPTLRTPRGADAFPPRDETSIDRTGLRVRGSRTFRFTLVPQGGAPLDVPPAVWTYFDPETGTYRTLRTDSAQVAVTGTATPGEAAPAPVGPAAGLIADASWQRRGVPVGVLWGVLAAGLGIPVLALGATALVRRRRLAALADTPDNRRRRALARADARLAQTSDPAEAERAVHGYLSDRFGLATSGLDRVALADALDAAAVPDAPHVLAVLAALDVAQFAPALARTPVADTVTEARATLAAIETGATPAPTRRRSAAVAAIVLIALAAAPHAQTPAVPGGPDEGDRLIALGVQLAAERDSSGAAAAFDGAIAAGRAAGRVSVAAEHDAGTLALARGDAGRARLHTERAARLAPFTAPVQTNAALARALARIPPETAGARAWRTVRGIAGPTGLVALALALTYVALALALNGRRRPALIAGVVAGVAVVVAVTALVEATRAEGVVLTAVELRAEPAPDATPDGAVAPGALVRMGETRGTWRAVTSGGRAGWIPAASVETL